MDAIAFVLGGLFPTGILTALLVWSMGRITQSAPSNRPAIRAAVANGSSLILCMLIVGFALDDGGLQALKAAFLAYFFPQAFWSVVWFFVLKGRSSAAVKALRAT